MAVVFTDVDGTLALRKFIPESTKVAIEKLRRNGHKIFICTGRAKSYVINNFYDYADGFICFNGRYAFDKENILIDKPIEKGLVFDIKKRLDTRRDLAHVFFDLDRGYYFGNMNHYKRCKEAWDDNFLRLNRKIDEIRAYNFDIFYNEDKDFEDLNILLEGICTLNKHQSNFSLDAAIKGFEKADAFKNVCEILNIKYEDTYAIGDGYNDVEMVKAAYRGIAMGNGVEEIKKVSDYVTSKIEDDGFYRAMEFYSLI